MERRNQLRVGVVGVGGVTVILGGGLGLPGVPGMVIFNGSRSTNWDHSSDPREVRSSESSREIKSSERSRARVGVVGVGGVTVILGGGLGLPGVPGMVIFKGSRSTNWDQTSGSRKVRSSERSRARVGVVGVGGVTVILGGGLGLPGVPGMVIFNGSRLANWDQSSCSREIRSSERSRARVGVVGVGGVTVILGGGLGLPGVPGMLILRGSRATNWDETSGSRKNRSPERSRARVGVVGVGGVTVILGGSLGLPGVPGMVSFRGSRLDAWLRTPSAHWAKLSGPRENRLSEMKLTRAMRSWTAGGDQGQIMIRFAKGLGKLTLQLRGGLASHRNGQCIHVENAEDEGDESGFGEHDNRECCEEEEITTAPGLKFWR